MPKEALTRKLVTVSEKINHYFKPAHVIEGLLDTLPPRRPFTEGEFIADKEK